MSKKISWVSLFIIFGMAYLLLDTYYFGIYRNDKIVDVTVIGKDRTDTLYFFKDLQPGQFKFRIKDKSVELFDIKTDTAFYSKVMYNLKDRGSWIIIDEYKDGKRVNSTEISI